MVGRCNDPNDASVINLDDGKGALQYAVAYNGGGGISILDATGRVIAKQRGANVWHVETLDSGTDGQGLIAYSDVSGKISIRDTSGKLHSKFAGPNYLTNFSIIRWPTRTSEECFLSSPGGTVSI